MPIKFACEHCGQRLNVSSSKAGVTAKCPKCQQRITVPDADATTPASPPNPPPGDVANDDENPYAEFEVYDDEVEWTYATEDLGPETRPQLDTGSDRIAIPRRVLYLQGMLLGSVALISFWLGLLAAGKGPAVEATATPQPSVLSGEVVFTSGGGRSRPDVGAAVLVLPLSQLPAPTDKAPIDGLRPGDPLPREDSHNLRIIQSIGGAYTRVDAEGRYQIQLPDSGRYFVLVVSKNSDRSQGMELDKADIAQLGRYVQPPTDLLANSKYQWREVAIRNQHSLNVSF